MNRLPLLSAVALACILSLTARAEITVHTDFEGGSAKVVSIDQATQTIRFMPGGNPARGWPCWWYLRADDVQPNSTVTFELVPSDALIPQEGGYKGKPLPLSWAAADRAVWSINGQHWLQTPPATKEPNRIIYRVPSPTTSLWLAWGPPFTPKDATALVERVAAGGKWKAFELARSREGHSVTALRLGESKDRPVVWVQARQHAWESGGSWVCAGFVQWVAEDKNELAQWLREHVEIVAVPIMDVDHVATGDGGKDALPQDHNRDWSDKPHWPEVAAAQSRLKEYGQRLAIFIDLHNPGPGDRTFFYTSPKEMLSAAAAERQDAFLKIAEGQFRGPIPYDPKTRESGEKYHPLWRQISKNWVHGQANPEAIAMTLENAWNTPGSTDSGYRMNGVQFGRTLAIYLQQQQKNR